MCIYLALYSALTYVRYYSSVSTENGSQFARKAHFYRKVKRIDIIFVREYKNRKPGCFKNKKNLLFYDKKMLFL